ncbi:MAG: hypothetical protein IRZ16_01940 [Myxococcaceae bacterium]|nr:hypothetical protein [Myxococcaceae bacterium]
MSPRWFVPLLSAPLWVACYPTTFVCGEHPEPLTRDGGEIACTRAEDCPRLATEQLCTTTRPVVEAPCVACDELRCVRHVAEDCRE